MSVRYQRRINLGGGLGLNLSKSGVSVSQRTPFGSIGTSGYSVKSGIPGLSYRKYSGRKKGSAKDFALMMLAFMLIAAFFYFVISFIKTLFLLMYHYSILFFKWVKQTLAYRKAQKDFKDLAHRKDVLFVQFDTGSLPENLRKSKVYIDEIFVKNGQSVNQSDVLATIIVGDTSGTIPAQKSGIVTFYQLPGSHMRKNAFIYRVDG